jgi:hypothetical protein
MTRSAAAFAIAMVWAAAADAHQLDEYLQAARIAIGPGPIVVEMSLTPGAAVAGQIFSFLDRDDDGEIAAPEAAAYGERVLSDLVLDLDGRSCPLTLLRAESPSWSEMRDGVGTIRLDAECGITASRGRHRLRFVNSHRPDISVYLVNALMPSTSDIVITSQQRDARQHGIVLEFDRSSPYLGALWIVFPLAAVTALVFCRRHEVR